MNETSWKAYSGQINNKKDTYIINLLILLSFNGSLDLILINICLLEKPKKWFYEIDSHQVILATGDTSDKQ